MKSITRHPTPLSKLQLLNCKLTQSYPNPSSALPLSPLRPRRPLPLSFVAGYDCTPNYRVTITYISYLLGSYERNHL